MSKKLILSIIATVVLVWLVVGFIPFYVSGGMTHKAGLFGDSFGFVNSLISGLALAGVIVAVRMQAKELHESAIEQKETAQAQRDSINTLMLSSYINAAVSIVNSPPLLTIEQEQSLVRVRHAMELAEERLVKALPLKATPAKVNLVVDRLNNLAARVRAFTTYPETDITRITIRNYLSKIRQELSVIENDIDPSILATMLNSVGERLILLDSVTADTSPPWSHLFGTLDNLANSFRGAADEFAEKHFR